MCRMYGMDRTFGVLILGGSVTTNSTISLRTMVKRSVPARISYNAVWKCSTSSINGPVIRCNRLGTNQIRKRPPSRTIFFIIEQGPDSVGAKRDRLFSKFEALECNRRVLHISRTTQAAAQSSRYLVGWQLQSTFGRSFRNWLGV